MILVEEAVIALDIRHILMSSGQYLPVIFSSKKEPYSSIIESDPELIITSLNIYRDIPEKTLNRLSAKLILLETGNFFDLGRAGIGSAAEVISFPFSSDVLMSKVENLLYSSHEDLACCTS